MIRYRAEETIARSPEEVWAFAADIEEHPRWMDVTDARLLRGRPTEPGARAREVVRFGPRRFDVELEVAAAEPGRRIAWRMIGGGPFRGEFALELEPMEAASTRATFTGQLTLRGLWRLMEPIVAMEVRKNEARELRRLREVVESRPVAIATPA